MPLLGEKAMNASDESEESEEASGSSSSEESTDSALEITESSESFLLEDETRMVKSKTDVLQVFSPSQLRSIMLEAVDKVVALCGVTRGAAWALLHSRAFATDAVVEAFFQEADLAAAAALAEGEAPLWVTEGYSTDAVPNLGEPPRCRACHAYVKDDLLASPFDCAHRFCIRCLLEVFTFKSDDDGAPKCPLFGECQSTVRGVRIPTRQPWFLDEWHRVVAREYVAQRPELLWCPASTCNNVIKVSRDLLTEDAAPVSITCQCGYSYCSKCAEPAHRPVPCSVMRRWVAMCKKYERHCADTTAWLGQRMPTCSLCMTGNGGTAENCANPFFAVCASRLHAMCYSCIQPVFPDAVHSCGPYSAECRRASLVRMHMHARLVQEQLSLLDPLAQAIKYVTDRHMVRPDNRAEQVRREALSEAQREEEDRDQEVHQRLLQLADEVATLRESRMKVLNASREKLTFRQVNTTELATKQQRLATVRATLSRRASDTVWYRPADKATAEGDWLEGKAGKWDRREKAELEAEAAQLEADVQEGDRAVAAMMYDRLLSNYATVWQARIPYAYPNMVGLQPADVLQVATKVTAGETVTVEGGRFLNGADIDALLRAEDAADRFLHFFRPFELCRQRLVNVEGPMHSRLAKAKDLQESLDRRNFFKSPNYLASEGTRALVTGRRVLMHTYVCGLFLPKSVQPDLFYYQQTQLLMSLGTLAEEIQGLMPRLTAHVFGATLGGADAEEVVHPEDARVAAVARLTAQVDQLTTAVCDIFQGISAENAAAKLYVTVETICENGLKSSDPTSPESYAFHVLSHVPMEVRLMVVQMAVGDAVVTAAGDGDVDDLGTDGDELNPTDEYIGIYQRRVRLVMKGPERAAYNLRACRAIAVEAAEAAHRVDLDNVDRASALGRRLREDVFRVHAGLVDAFHRGGLPEFLCPQQRDRAVRAIATSIREATALPSIAADADATTEERVPVFTILWSIFAPKE